MSTEYSRPNLGLEDLPLEELKKIAQHSEEAMLAGDSEITQDTIDDRKALIKKREAREH